MRFRVYCSRFAFGFIFLRAPTACIAKTARKQVYSSRILLGSQFRQRRCCLHCSCGACATIFETSCFWLSVFFAVIRGCIATAARVRLYWICSYLFICFAPLPLALQVLRECGRIWSELLLALFFQLLPLALWLPCGVYRIWVNALSDFICFSRRLTFDVKRNSYPIFVQSYNRKVQRPRTGIFRSSTCWRSTRDENNI